MRPSIARQRSLPSIHLSGQNSLAPYFRDRRQQKFESVISRCCICSQSTANIPFRSQPT